MTKECKIGITNLCPAITLYLCLSDEERNKSMELLEEFKSRVNEIADASSCVCIDNDGVSAVIHLRNYKDRDHLDICGLLIHEAVHVWQGWCEFYGETNPGDEQEAYAIQSIASELINDFSRRAQQLEKN